MKQIVDTVFLETRLKDIRMMLDTEVKKFDENSYLLHKKLDVAADSTTRLIEYITAFNKDYLNDLHVKTK